MLTFRRVLHASPMQWDRRGNRLVDVLGASRPGYGLYTSDGANIPDCVPKSSIAEKLGLNSRSSSTLYPTMDLCTQALCTVPIMSAQSLTKLLVESTWLKFDCVGSRAVLQNAVRNRLSECYQDLYPPEVVSVLLSFERFSYAFPELFTHLILGRLDDLMASASAGRLASLLRVCSRLNFPIHHPQLRRPVFDRIAHFAETGALPPHSALTILSALAYSEPWSMDKETAKLVEAIKSSIFSPGAECTAFNLGYTPVQLARAVNLLTRLSAYKSELAQEAIPHLTDSLGDSDVSSPLMALFTESTLPETLRPVYETITKAHGDTLLKSLSGLYLWNGSLFDSPQLVESAEKSVQWAHIRPGPRSDSRLTSTRNILRLAMMGFPKESMVEVIERAASSAAYVNSLSVDELLDLSVTACVVASDRYSIFRPLINELGTPLTFAQSRLLRLCDRAQLSKPTYEETDGIKVHSCCALPSRIAVPLPPYPLRSLLKGNVEPSLLDLGYATGVKSGSHAVSVHVPGRRHQYANSEIQNPILLVMERAVKADSATLVVT